MLCFGRAIGTLLSAHAHVLGACLVSQLGAGLALEVCNYRRILRHGMQSYGMQSYDMAIQVTYKSSPPTTSTSAA